MNFFKRVITFFSTIWNAIHWKRTANGKKAKSAETVEGLEELKVQKDFLLPDEVSEEGFFSVPLDCGEDVPVFQEVTNAPLPEPIQSYSEEQKLPPQSLATDQSLNEVTFNSMCNTGTSGVEVKSKSTDRRNPLALPDTPESNSMLPEAQINLEKTSCSNEDWKNTTLEIGEPGLLAPLNQQCDIKVKSSSSFVKDEPRNENDSPESEMKAISEYLTNYEEVTNGINCEEFDDSPEEGLDIFSPNLNSHQCKSTEKFDLNDFESECLSHKESAEILIVEDFQQSCTNTPEIPRLECDQQNDNNDQSFKEINDENNAAIGNCPGDGMENVFRFIQPNDKEVHQSIQTHESQENHENLNVVNLELIASKTLNHLDTIINVNNEEQQAMLAGNCGNAKDLEQHPYTNLLQTSISSPKLINNTLFDEDVLKNSFQYSSNFLVRSDSMVNFFPICEHSADLMQKETKFSLVPTSNEIQQNRIIRECGIKMGDEIKIAEKTPETKCNLQNVNCLEEIMCTSRGILKLSDSSVCLKNHSSNDFSIEANQQSQNFSELEENTVKELIFISSISQESSLCDESLLETIDRTCDKSETETPIELTIFPGSLNLLTTGDQYATNMSEEEDDCNYFISRNEEHSFSKDFNKRINNIQAGKGTAYNSEYGYGNYQIEAQHLFIESNTDDVMGNDNSSILFSPIQSFDSRVENNSKLILEDGLHLYNTPMIDHSVGMLEGRECLQKPEKSSNVYEGCMKYDEFGSSSSSFRSDTFYPLNNLNFNVGIPILSSGCLTFPENSFWQQPNKYTPSIEAAKFENFEVKESAYMKTESLFYNNSSLEPDEISVKEENTETYQMNREGKELCTFNDCNAFVFGRLQEKRKDFDPCVGAAPLKKPHWENNECCTTPIMSRLLNLNEPNDYQSGQSAASLTEHRLGTSYQNSNFKVGFETKIQGQYCTAFGDGDESVQKTMTDNNLWDISDRADQINDFENENYGLEGYTPDDVVTLTYFQGQIPGDNSMLHEHKVDCNFNNYRFVDRSYEDFKFPVVSIPVPLSDHSFPNQKGRLLSYPANQIEIKVSENDIEGQMADGQNDVQPAFSPCYWNQLECDTLRNEAQTESTSKNNIPSMKAGLYLQPQNCIEGIGGIDKEATEDSTLLDPYFQLSDNASLQTLKSKTDSYNGSLFCCESLRSILSSHNTESDSLIPSLGCHTHFINPLIVQQACKTSVSNDSFPSVIVEESCNKSVDDDYSATEQFMNDVNTALNESMMDRMLCEKSVTYESTSQSADTEDALLEKVSDEIKVVSQKEHMLTNDAMFGSCKEEEQSECSAFNIDLVGKIYNETIAERVAILQTYCYEIIVNLIDSIGSKSLSDEDEETKEIENKNVGIHLDLINCSAENNSGSDFLQENVWNCDNRSLDCDGLKENVVENYMVFLHQTCSPLYMIKTEQSGPTNETGCFIETASSNINDLITEKSMEKTAEETNSEEEKQHSSSLGSTINKTSSAELVYNKHFVACNSIKKNEIGNEIPITPNYESIESNLSSINEENDSQADFSQIIRKSRKNRRPKRKECEEKADGIVEKGSITVAEEDIGDGSKLGKHPTDGYLEPPPKLMAENSQSQPPCPMKQSAEGEPGTDHDNDEINDENTNEQTNHEEQGGSLENSSNNRKKRNRRRKRKN